MGTTLFVSAHYVYGRWTGTSTVSCSDPAVLDELELRLLAAGGQVLERVPRALRATPSILVHDIARQLGVLRLAEPGYEPDEQDRVLARGGPAGDWLPFLDSRERLACLLSEQLGRRIDPAELGGAR